jgi:hypothetical protein
MVTMTYFDEKFNTVEFGTFNEALSYILKYIDNDVKDIDISFYPEN